MIDLEPIARILQVSAYNNYRATITGGAAPYLTKMYARIQVPEPGDWVAEISTIYFKDRHALDAVGTLEAVEREPVTWPDTSFVWDEATEGKPHPTEKVFYLRTLDGRRYRWTNAHVIAILDKFPEDFRETFSEVTR